MTTIYTGGAGIIVFNKNHTKVLLGNRTDGQGYCFCGGKKDGNEIPIETSIREAKEEFGIEIEPKYVSYLGNIFAKVKSKGQYINVISDIFATDTFSGEIVPQEEEISEIVWCDFEDICKLDKIFPTTLVCINKFVMPQWGFNQ